MTDWPARLRAARLAEYLHRFLQAVRGGGRTPVLWRLPEAVWRGLWAEATEPGDPGEVERLFGLPVDLTGGRGGAGVRGGGGNPMGMSFGSVTITHEIHEWTEPGCAEVKMRPARVSHVAVNERHVCSVLEEEVREAEGGNGWVIGDPARGLLAEFDSGAGWRCQVYPSRDPEEVERRLRDWPRPVTAEELLRRKAMGR